MSDSQSVMLESMISTMVNNRYKDIPPTENELKEIADQLRNSMQTICPVTDSEFENIKKRLMQSLVVRMDVGVFINDRNTQHKPWIANRRGEIDFFYWDRYKKYLEQQKHWNSRVVTTLDRVSDEILDLMGDPQQKEPFFIRGLILGDVQSGKTANYTAIANKAADTGYRVIIILAGMQENLRQQTQSRIDSECAGIRSDYYLDPKLATVKKTTAVGVGRIDKRKHIAQFTSVRKDFSSDILMSNRLSLHSISDPIVLVVKKNKRILENLATWLKNNASDGGDGLIDLPMLLIDDEADNASVNTKDADSPAAINACIRKLLHLFSHTTYVGITATPFANIFIDPDTEDAMIGDDLFPADFIYSLEAPTDYIGAEKIFSDDAEYSSALVPLRSDEMDHFFPFNHKKDIEVAYLPPSMKEAIAYFLLVNAVRDIRGDQKQHRSMMIHVSRYTDVQDRLQNTVYEWLNRIRTDVKAYAKLPLEMSMSFESIRFLSNVWEKHKLSALSGVSWEDCLQNWLNRAIAPIEVRAVNQRTGASSLNYYDYAEDGFRVIAVGGTSLSRGLTLEGLCVSYFYRRSQMYDTLMQMGRWFGYRPNYKDLFKVWISSEAIDWYGFIARATAELRDEIRKMKEAHQTPSDFGLKVRQDPEYALLVTARNKMKSATLIKRPVTVSGHLLETPRLKRNRSILDSNENEFRAFIEKISAYGTYQQFRNRPYWRGIFGSDVSHLLRQFETSPWHLAFQGRALAEYIDEKMEGELWDVVLMTEGEGEKLQKPLYFGRDHTPYAVNTTEYRKIKVDEKTILVSGTNIRVGSGGCTKIGLTPDEIRKAQAQFDAQRGADKKKHYPDSAYLIRGRAPLLMLHILSPYKQNGECDIEGTAEHTADLPRHFFALGIGFPETGKETKTAAYMVNMVELRGWIDFIEEEDGGDDTAGSN